MKLKNNFRLIMTMVIGVISLFSTGKVLAEAVPYTVYDEPIANLHPTQAALGKVQIAYKITEYLNSSGTGLSEDYFKDFNDDNGYLEGNYYLAGGLVTDKKLRKQESIRQKIPTAEVYETPKVPVVIGYDGKYYAIDGHHGSTTYLYLQQQLGLGYSQINLSVIADYHTLSQGEFYQVMTQQKYVFPKAYNQKTGNYETFDLEKLPEMMVSNQFVNDPFRSLNYFWRNIAINKDTVSVPFAEFYWGEFLAATEEFKDIPFKTTEDYLNAFQRGNHIFQQLIQGNPTYMELFQKVITQPYGITPEQIGLQGNYDETAIDKRLDRLKTALNYYQSSPSLQVDNQDLFVKPVVVDKSLLVAQISQAEKVKSDLYTADSFQKLVNAILLAKEVNQKDQGTQEEVDQQIANLKAVQKELVLKAGELDLKELEASLTQAKAVDGSLYTINSYQQLLIEVSAAEDLLKQLEQKNFSVGAVTQEMINQQTEKLKIAVSALKIKTEEESAGQPEIPEKIPDSTIDSSSVGPNESKTKPVLHEKKKNQVKTKGTQKLPQTGEKKGSNLFAGIAIISLALVGGYLKLAKEF